MIYPEGNKIAETFEAGLIPNLEKIGIRLTLEAVPMAELLEKYYKKGDRDMDMIYLATNFDVVFDPSVNFVVDEDGDPNWSYTNHKDEELYRLAVELRATEPGDTMEYMYRWIAFQEQFNKSLPMLPLYSNMYFDFYTENLHDYLIGENIAWSTAILEASLYEATEEEAAEEFVEGA
jgi:ABC-type transport system substrate-binding protein